MAEWKGPWKCERCGKVCHRDDRHHLHGDNPAEWCSGPCKPHDRRAPDALVEALKKILGWREYHDHFERTQADVVAWIEGIASAALKGAANER